MSSFTSSSNFLALILGTFIILSIPLSLLPFFDYKYYDLALFYTFAIAFTHFSSTYIIYFKKEYWNFFTRTHLNIFIYIAMPLFFICSFSFIFFNKEIPLYEAMATAIIVIIRITDYFHTNKQTLGIVQQFSRGEPHNMLRLHYYILILFLVLNYFEKKYSKGSEEVNFVLMAVLLISFIKQMKTMNPRTRIYFLIQSLALVPGVLNPDWYFLGLAVHSIEYHYLIKKRYFNNKKSYVLFFVLLLLFSFLVTRTFNISLLKDSFFNLSFIYSGVVFTHYYLDSFIWRFKNSFHREELIRL